MRHRFSLRTLIFSFVSFFVLSAGFAAESNWVTGKSQHVQSRLISQLRELGPETHEVLMGLEFKLDPGWHIYWKNPGDVGYAPRLKWTLPEGWKAEALEYAMPLFFPAPGNGEIKATSFGYKNSALYPFYLKSSLKEPSELSTIRFSTQLEFLICEEICIPESAELEIVLPVQTEKRSSHSERLDRSFSEIPRPSQEIQARWIRANQVEVLTPLAADENLEKNLFLYSPVRAGYFWKIKSQNADKIILDLEEGFDSKPLEIFVRNTQTGFGGMTTLAPAESLLASGFWFALLFAFIGGVILNLMPCVLPVLFLKANSLIQLREKHQDSKSSLLFTIFGILSSFLLLALVVVLLKGLGQQIGWGFQFQSPLFVSFMLLVIFIFSLNLFGLFEIELPVSMNTKLGSSSGSFFEGMLATLLATPCSAPFLGTALAFAFSQTTSVLILFFIVMGLGLSLPYFLLLLSPKLIALLPRPGNWMLKLKSVLGFGLLLTAIWLLYVLSQQASIATLFLILLTGLLIAFFISIFQSRFKWLAVLGIFCGSLFFVHQLSADSPTSKAEVEFSETLIADLSKQHPAVFINITADWCITCKVNEAAVLNTKRFQELLKENNIHYVSFDWTQRNDDIGRFLERNNRAGIPFAMLLSKNESHLFPELLSFSIVEKKINEWSKSQPPKR